MDKPGRCQPARATARCLTDAGEVVFWDHEEEAEEGQPATRTNLYHVSDSFAEFLDDLTE
ncbi:hypothetical protein R8Z50_30310 [Longispora sp. K20-0274]|uniref:hypothetical protein n=1 Tax=Longispora sp. K20-0274 TaxID=3088255 RepID=UPI003999DD4C